MKNYKDMTVELGRILYEGMCDASGRIADDFKLIPADERSTYLGLAEFILETGPIKEMRLELITATQNLRNALAERDRAWRLLGRFLSQHENEFLPVEEYDTSPF